MNQVAAEGRGRRKAKGFASGHQSRRSLDNPVLSWLHQQPSTDIAFIRRPLMRQEQVMDSQGSALSGFQGLALGLAYAALKARP
jgi:hypothetical protein